MKILLPSDGSAAALDAVRHALRLTGAGLVARFLLANVQEPAHWYEVLMAPDAGDREAAMRAAGEHALAPARDLLAAAGVDAEVRVLMGDPGHALVELAELEGCDAIVMGTRGHGILGGSALGSVARAVLAGAGVAVTIVRHADAPDGAPGPVDEAERADA